VAAAERLLRAGGLAVLPTDTVYGVGCAAYRRDACERVYALKARPQAQATALVLGSVDELLANVLPELLGRAGSLCRRLLPGPLTLVVPNPSGRFAYLCGGDPKRIGVRVPELPAAVAALADAVGGLALTSANLRGEPPAARLEDVPAALVDACALLVAGGELRGTASTVVDVTGSEPRVLREGAVPAADIDALLR
jgi:tRNA threonylcarbamoyl adenosine modification protein (Sua5/YciO/YrdC/YwlC family)